MLKISGYNEYHFWHKAIVDMLDGTPYSVRGATNWDVLNELVALTHPDRVSEELYEKCKSLYDSRLDYLHVQVKMLYIDDEEA
ncbi:MAG: hypothetical protein OCD01_12930 [Fibrobacterales bacterium]